MTITDTFIQAENDQLTREFKSEKKIPVVEIFGPTIQGEGPLCGTKTMFVRFGGCDYRCKQCDSLHAVLPKMVKKNARRMTQEEIFEELSSKMGATGTRTVTFSGGNPCMWELTELVEAIQRIDGIVAVETQGTLAPEWIKKVNILVVSPKTPGMGEKFEEGKLRAFLKTSKDEPFGGPYVALKIVVFSQIDIEHALYMRSIGEALGMMPGQFYMSLGNPYPPRVNEETLEASENVPHKELVSQLLRSYRILVEDMCSDPRLVDWVFLPQLHVLLWGNEAER